MNTATKMLNEKPSKLSNIGQDVYGAKRHHFDTYDNPEKRAEKAREKAQKDNRKNLKEETIKALVDGADFVGLLCAYEMALTLDKISGYQGSSSGTKESLNELKTYVLSLRAASGYQVYAAAVDSFNRLSRKCSKIRWNVRSLEDAQKYLAPKKKESFKEFNGAEKPWSLGDSGKFNPNTTSELSALTRAVQFGNSLTLQEREYCLQNLLDSIKMLNEHYRFGFKSMAFSFGARGKAGSIAHYQDSQKVLAFNRGWSGAFVHELGHAVDYSLGVISKKMPYEIRCNYRTKITKLLKDKKITNSQWDYYMIEKEIFARLFEVYLREELPGMTEFMQVTFDESIMPDLDDQSREWMRGILESSRACHFADDVGL